MFNRISFFAIIIIAIICFASCTKEAINLPQNQTETTVGERSQTIEIDVVEINNTLNAGNLSVDFTANFDFSQTVLEQTQYLNFSDATGNVSTLTFQVNSFQGVNGSLQAVFAIGGNNLAGLSLTEAQDIIIEDIYVE